MAGMRKRGPEQKVLPSGGRTSNIGRTAQESRQNRQAAPQQCMTMKHGGGKWQQME